MRCVTIDLAVEAGERRQCEERERAQVEYEFVEDGIIDERVDDMTISDVYDAIQKDDEWLTAAQNAAQADAKDASYLALGKILAHMIRDHSKRLVEKENV